MGSYPETKTDPEFLPSVVNGEQSITPRTVIEDLHASTDHATMPRFKFSQRLYYFWLVVNKLRAFIKGLISKSD